MKSETNHVRLILYIFGILGCLYLITDIIDKLSSDHRDFYSKSKKSEVKTENYTKEKSKLPAAENVLLATGYRTGSSFLAEIFNQNEDVFYVRTKT